MDTLKNEIKERLKEALRELNLDIKKTAKKLDSTDSRVMNLRGGHQKITPDIALEVEDKLNINATWLIFGRGEMFLPPKMDIKKEEEELNKKTMSNEDFIKYLRKRDKDLEEVKKELEELRANQKK